LLILISINVNVYNVIDILRRVDELALCWIIGTIHQITQVNLTATHSNT
jgi:hypothetical protein